MFNLPVWAQPWCASAGFQQAEEMPTYRALGASLVRLLISTSPKGSHADASHSHAVIWAVGKQPLQASSCLHQETECYKGVWDVLALLQAGQQPVLAEAGGWAAGEHAALALHPSPLKSSLILWGLALSYSWYCGTKFVMTKYCKTTAEHSQGQQSKACHSYEITDLIQWTSIGKDMTFDLQQEAKKNSHGFTNSIF